MNKFIVVNTSLSQECRAWGLSDAARAAKGMDKLNFPGTRPDEKGFFATQADAEAAALYLVSTGRGHTYHILERKSTAGIPASITRPSP